MEGGSLPRGRVTSLSPEGRTGDRSRAKKLVSAHAGYGRCREPVRLPVVMFACIEMDATPDSAACKRNRCIRQNPSPTVER